ncbi:hypothetical protein AB0L75_24450 [Streptomyces sp. NPDC052101]|uniref:hypothetical protein n=1 Tax=Streptomyces sp. NPDC052101 TaxID=3155763 RepID=UPI0034292513
MCKAFYSAYDENLCEFLSADDIAKAMAEIRETVSATIVTPYPSGFPILVPGQAIRAGVLAFTEALDTREIHGYTRGVGYRVFTEAALSALAVRDEDGAADADLGREGV